MDLHLRTVYVRHVATKTEANEPNLHSTRFQEQKTVTTVNSNAQTTADMRQNERYVFGFALTQTIRSNVTLDTWVPVACIFVWFGDTEQSSRRNFAKKFEN